MTLIGPLALRPKNLLLIFFIYLDKSMISWKSRTKETFSKVFSKAKYRVAITTTCEIQWIIYLFQDLCVSYIQFALFYGVFGSEHGFIATDQIQRKLKPRGIKYY